MFVPTIMYRSADDSRSGKAAAEAEGGDGDDDYEDGGGGGGGGPTPVQGGIEAMREALFELFATHEKVSNPLPFIPACLGAYPPQNKGGGLELPCISTTAACILLMVCLCFDDDADAAAGAADVCRH